jgi:predicted metal-dependent phosphotriesterase family hydrolase
VTVPILLDAWGMTPKYESYSLILDDEEVLTAEVMKYRAAGGGTICDPTNGGIGRNLDGLARISKATGVNIVMGAGWYRERFTRNTCIRSRPINSPSG